jgi:hypothetical protein
VTGQREEGRKKRKEKRSLPRDKLKPDRNDNINKQNTREPNKNRPSYANDLDNTYSKRREEKGRTDGRKLQGSKRAREINKQQKPR